MYTLHLTPNKPADGTAVIGGMATPSKQLSPVFLYVMDVADPAGGTAVVVSCVCKNDPADETSNNKHQSSQMAGCSSQLNYLLG